MQLYFLKSQVPALRFDKTHFSFLPPVLALKVLNAGRLQQTIMDIIKYLTPYGTTISV